MKKKTIHISYCWEEPNSAIIRNWMIPSLEDSFDFIIDIKNCHYRYDIDEFERSIGRAERVIVVLSYPYLRSLACMYEFSLIMDNPNWKERVYPIYIGDFKRGDDRLTKKILNFWKKAYDDFEVTYIDNKKSKPYKNKSERYKLVLKYGGDILDYISNINSLDLSKLSDNKYKILREELLEKQEILVDEKPIEKITLFE